MIDVEDYYTRYGPMVYRRCRRLLGDDQEALDAMQDVFVSLIRQAERLEDHAPSSLLFRIATHVSLNRLRSKRRRPEVPDSELLVRIAAIGESRSESRVFLRQLMRDQSELTRLIAVLRWVDQMTLDEVADHVGMSVSGVRKRLRKLKRDVDSLHMELVP